MTIKKIIEIYNDYDRISGTLISGNSEEDTKYNFETIEAIQSINVILHKYQKIKEVVNNWHHDIEAKDFECMAEIADVVEDGNDD